MKTIKLFAIVLLIISSFIKLQSQTTEFPFQNSKLTMEERINDLVSRLTLKEKSTLMLYNSPAIDRLNIKEYNWWNECLHGIARAGKATVFPQTIGLAATFDPELAFRVATAISDEARAKYNAAIKKDNRTQYMGLSFWTPNINIFRDPRWGRGQETYGEDPLLTSRMGVAFVKGLQGSDSHYLKVAACAKHFAVHSGPEKTRHTFNAIPEERDFRETYLPAFKALSDAGVEAVMCAYNRLYDQPCCGSSPLLSDILRKEWGFKGHIVTDCWALDDIWLRHKVVPTQAEAAAMAAKAGVNLNCGYIYKFLPEAVEKGLITEKDVDNAIKPMLRTRFKLGLFDPDALNPYSKLDESLVNCEKHQAIAYEVAAKSVVLLKNNNVLPLNTKTLKHLYVTGPMAAEINALLGNYNGFSGSMATILEGIIQDVDAGTVVNYNIGCILDNKEKFHGYWEADGADATVVVLGISRLFEGEDGDAMLNDNGGDRVSLSLPENQLTLLKKIREAAPKKPIIAVITGGSAIELKAVLDIADAVLFAWYPGEKGGNAVADIIFGKQNPSGKLPLTFYASEKDLPDFDNYAMKGRTYRYFEGKAQFPFGFGLSYTQFEYSQLLAKITNPKKTDSIAISLTVKNSGNYDGDEVVQLYAAKEISKISHPLKTLIGFQRISLKKGESTNIVIKIPASLLAYWDVKDKQYKIEKGDYRIEAGSSSEDIRVKTKVSFSN
ncbi:MAG: glycoside hydrolase family 3 C-terminal domain-containing protein [Bacteroidetes bacterium]|nr:glycoside hydrolase family 3 C-terminal domain-containing protein [Bacteroidota bacterium]